MKELRGYLIDPEKKTIEPVIHNGDYKQIYKFIGADCFDVVRIDDENMIFVDDEGLLNGTRYFFMLKGYPQPFAGKGLLMGSNDEGDTVSSSMRLEDVQKLVVGYRELSVRGFITEERTDAEMPWGGKGFSIKSTPVFGPPEPKDE